MDLAAFAPLVAVVAGALPALRGRLPRGAVENGRGGLGLAPGRPAQHLAQIVHHHGEDPGRDPAPALLVDGRPGREVARQVAPRRPGMHDPAQGIEHLAQGMPPLGRRFGHQRQVGGHEGPFLIAHVGRIGLAGEHLTFHAARIPSP